MSNGAVFGTSIKDYAEQRGKTVQAVYQQMKRKENAAALEGHVLTHRVGNKDVKYLDDEAVAILDKSSQSAPLTMVGEEIKQELAKANETIDQLKAAAFLKQGEVNALKEQLAEKEDKLLTLAEPGAQIDTLKAQVNDLRGERDELKGKVADAEDRTLKANSEAFKAKLYVAELEAYLKLPWFVRTFTKKPELKNVLEGEEE